MKKIIRTFGFLVAMFIAFSVVEMARASGDTAYGGVPVYGGGVITEKVGEVLIDKTVKNPASGIYVDHLGLSDPKYRPTQIAYFRIKIQNPGTKAIEKVQIIDKLPEYLEFMSGAGVYDKENKTLTINVDNLEAGTYKEYEYSARVMHQAVFPKDKNVVCPVNIVDAKADDKIDRDESQFCIEKEMIVPQVPTAGPSEWLMTISAITGALGTGIYLRKKSNS